MTRLAASFVLGYHGCDETVGRKAVTEGVALIRSDKDYDWLGPGFAVQSHVQIAVCNDDCILGLFLPLPYPQLLNSVRI